MNSIEQLQVTPELIVALTISLIIYVLYLLTNYRLLKSIPANYQTWKPIWVWTMLIPIANLIIHFFLVYNTSKSLFKLFNAHGKDTKHLNLTFNIGIAFCILTICNIIPAVAVVTSFFSTCLFVIYWIQLSKIKKMLHPEH